jgi:mannose-6-phosphate isomerase-like protein (cupin superfamily)
MNSQTRPAGAATSPAFTVEAGGSRIGRLLRVVGNEMLVKISSGDTNGAFTVLEDYTPPSGGPPLHVHHVQDEWWYILEGEYLFEVDGQEIHAGPGATVFARHGTRHTFMNVGTAMGRMLVTAVPGGLDVFFEEVDGVTPQGGLPDLEVLAALARKHGLEVLGPPLAARKQNKI